MVYFTLVIGLVALLLGGGWLVKGAVGLAEKLRISPIIIGLTIVALGTSLPELLISVEAALIGQGGIAAGNVVGSNIANVLLVLGVPALIAPFACNDEGARNTIYFLLALTLIFMVQMTWGPISRLDGLLLVACLAVFLGLQFHRARKESSANAQEEPDYIEEVGAVPQSPILIGVLLIAGLVTLPLGAETTVDSAVKIAKIWNVSDAVIGLTVIAIGTSLPELATTVMAARQGSAGVALGNVVGSNIFNMAAIMGITSLIVPVDVDPQIVSFDMLVMAGSTLILGGLVLVGLTLGRAAGALLCVGYCGYLIATATLWAPGT